MRGRARKSLPRLGGRIPSNEKSGREFVMNACVASFFHFLIFYEAVQWFHADGNFIFAADFQERKQTVCDFVWNHDTVMKNFVKNPTVLIWPVICRNNFQGR